jgi:hypothetical protein
MRQVNIVFTSLLKLWDFRLLIQRRPLKTDFRKRIITCYCTEAEIKLAQFAYRARIEPITRPDLI